MLGIFHVWSRSVPPHNTYPRRLTRSQGQKKVRNLKWARELRLKLRFHIITNVFYLLRWNILSTHCIGSSWYKLYMTTFYYCSPMYECIDDDLHLGISRGTTYSSEHRPFIWSVSGMNQAEDFLSHLLSQLTFPVQLQRGLTWDTLIFKDMKYL